MRLFLTLSFFVSVSATAAEHPNVLFIMSDDLRPQLGCYGDPVVKTPHLDAFASQALRFERAYVQSAICSPSRNSMMSGMRPNTTGLRGFGVNLRDALPDVITLPQHFKQQGYHAQAFGKIYHIYDESMLGDENDPESWSVPLQWPSVPVWGPEQHALRNELIKQARARGEVFDHPHDWPRAETWDDSDVPDEEMQDGEIAQMAAAFLQSRKGDGEPFFLGVGFLRPHLPFNAPKKYWDLYDPEALELPTFRSLPEGAPSWAVTQGIVRNYHNMPDFETIEESFLKRYLQAYLACISYVDACFGTVLSALADSGHADNTIVVFLGDHGYQMGEYDSWGHKHANFEISTRAPLLLRVPGMKQPGTAWEAPVEFLDLYPTLCELAGLSIPEGPEGASLAGLFRDPRVLPPKQVACSEMNRRGRIGRSIRSADFRYTEWRNPSGQIVARELYDHRDGEFLETKNVIDEAHPDIALGLSAQLAKLVPYSSP
ncbi:MAG: sulfatase [Verrucomicrobiota bacterium]